MVWFGLMPYKYGMLRLIRRRELGYIEKNQSNLGLIQINVHFVHRLGIDCREVNDSKNMVYEMTHFNDLSYFQTPIVL